MKKRNKNRRTFRHNNEYLQTVSRFLNSTPIGGFFGRYTNQRRKHRDTPIRIIRPENYQRYLAHERKTVKS